MNRDIISNEKFQEMQENLKEYMRAKAPLDDHIVTNNRWYEEQHQPPKTTVGGDMIAPTTGFLFHALASKHADAMDAFPSIRILERQPEGKATAELLSKMIPAELSRMSFRDTYSRGWWYKLKHGAACYGVFYSPEEQGIQIKRLDLLHTYWAPGIENIQDSPYLFLLSSVRRSEIVRRYPDAQDKNLDSGFHLYRQQGDVPAEGFVAVVDCYEKMTDPSGKTIVHLTKFCGDAVLDSTLFYPELLEKGLYEHGKYPVVMDVLYPQDSSPVGFGLVDIAKNPQCYIDKLDEIISRNALAAGKMRWMVKDNGGVNENELLDMGQDLIHVAGSLGEENIRAFQPRALDPYIIQHRQNKITELKEITGNRDVTGGGLDKSVTGYNAIRVLQDSGQKLMRDMLQESYRAIQEMMHMCIRLIRQFYVGEHLFPVDRDGEREFLRWSGQTAADSHFDFDIKILPQRPDTSAQDTANALALELFRTGFFRSDRYKEAEMALKIMEFDGKNQVEMMLRPSAEPSENTDFAE